MKKEEVELIICSLIADGQEAIYIKIYKDGTICRSGAGGLPAVGIGGMSFVHDSRYFDPLIEKVPQQILVQPLGYEEETPNGSLEYVIAFFGDSRNGITGERADWAKSTGIRIRIDQQSGFNHSIMGLMDGLISSAAELTNAWYFDVIMHSRWKVKSSAIPEETIITQPKTEEEINEDYENYIRQIAQSPRQWKLADFAIGKQYEQDGLTFSPIIHQTRQEVSIKFEPTGIKGLTFAEPIDKTELPKKKPWWKF